MWIKLLTSHTRKPATNNTMRILLVLVLIFVHSRQDNPCPDGFFGENCKLTCSRNCRPFENYVCDKSTGKCSEGCKIRLYGPTCNLTCNCPGYCIQATGKCMDDVTTTTASTQCHEAVQDCSCVVGYVVMVVIFIIMLCLIAVVAFLILRRRRYPAVLYRKREEEQQTDCEAEPTSKDTSPLTIEIQSPTPDAVSSMDEVHSETQVLIPTVVEGVAKQETEHLKEELRQTENILEGKTAEIEHLNLKLKNTEKKALVDRERIKAEHNNFLEKLGLQTNTHYEVLHSTKIDRSKVLECIKLNFDADKINRKHVSLNDERRMVNTAMPEQDNENQGGFVHYMGTCSNIPIVQTSSPQYFEVVADIELNKPLGERDVLLEIAFCKTEDRDVGQFTPRRENCYSFSIAYNVKKQGICVTTVAQKENNEIFSCLTNTTGCNITLEIGILIHDASKKIIIFNLNEKKTITTFDNVHLLIELWPVFGLSTRSLANISMGLITGSDIDMTEEKKILIDGILNPSSWRSKLPFPKY